MIEKKGRNRDLLERKGREGESIAREERKERDNMQ